MSLADVYQVFGPSWEREIKSSRERIREMEQIILKHRRRLIAADASLPDEYDGAAWWAAFEGPDA